MSNSTARDIVGLIAGRVDGKPVDRLTIMTPDLFRTLSAYAKVDRVLKVFHEYSEGDLYISFSAFFDGHLMVQWQDGAMNKWNYCEFELNEKTNEVSYSHYQLPPVDDSDCWDSSRMYDPSFPEFRLSDAIAVLLADADWGRPTVTYYDEPEVDDEDDMSYREIKIFLSGSP